MAFSGSRTLRIALFLIVWVAAIALLIARLHYGFLPEDDPALSYLGERTLQGGLPNVDFYDNYTGGLSFLSALAIRLFGARLISGRIMLLLFFVPWVLAIWYLASRITSWISALLVTCWPRSGAFRFILRRSPVGTTCISPPLERPRCFATSIRENDDGSSGPAFAADSRLWPRSSDCISSPPLVSSCSSTSRTVRRTESRSLLVGLFRIPDARNSGLCGRARPPDRQRRPIRRRCGPSRSLL